MTAVLAPGGLQGRLRAVLRGQVRQGEAPAVKAVAGGPHAGPAHDVCGAAVPTVQKCGLLTGAGPRVCQHSVVQAGPAAGTAQTLHPRNKSPPDQDPRQRIATAQSYMGKQRLHYCWLCTLRSGTAGSGLPPQTLARRKLVTLAQESGQSTAHTSCPTDEACGSSKQGHSTSSWTRRHFPLSEGRSRMPVEWSMIWNVLVWHCYRPRPWDKKCELSTDLF